MNYQEALDYLYSLSSRGIKLGLDNTARLLEHFGNPHRGIPVIHVAGTNGKGSTAAYVESILRASGYRVGLYTSPHLLDFRERIQINRGLIEPGEVAHWVTAIKQASEQLKLSPTFFEVGTVMAFLHFQQSRTDWNVIEVGMGGRLDSTNLCQGRVCIITSIARDHESSLGNRLEQIAEEKAGIIKHPCIVVSGVQAPEGVRVIQDRCRSENAVLLQWEQDFHINIQSHSIEGQVFDFKGPEIWYKELEISLAGRHQSVNAGLAVAACTAMSDPGITETHIRKGLKSAAWAGRLEVYRGQPTLLMDGAHNPESLKQLIAALSELFPHKRKIWVFGIMKDKPLEEIIQIISNYVDHMIVTQPKGDRSVSPDEIRDRLPDLIQSVDLAEHIPSALDRAFQVAQPEDLVVITGSLFMIAEAKQVIENQIHNS